MEVITEKVHFNFRSLLSCGSQRDTSNKLLSSWPDLKTYSYFQMANGTLKWNLYQCDKNIGIMLKITFARELTHLLSFLCQLSSISRTECLSWIRDLFGSQDSLRSLCSEQVCWILYIYSADMRCSSDPLRIICPSKLQSVNKLNITCWLAAMWR